MYTLKEFVKFGTENPNYINRLSLQLINHTYNCQVDKKWKDFNFDANEGLTESLKKAEIWKKQKTTFPSLNTHSIFQLKDLMDIPQEDLKETYSSIRDMFFVGRQMLSNFEHKVKNFPIFGKFIANTLKDHPYALVKDINKLEVICDGLNSEGNTPLEYDLELFPMLAGNINVSPKSTQNKKSNAFY